MKTILKTISYLTTFIGIVGYLETGDLTFTIVTAIGIIGIIGSWKINNN